MRLHGLIRSAELQENPPGSDQIEMVLLVQGVGRTSRDGSSSPSRSCSKTPLSIRTR